MILKPKDFYICDTFRAKTMRIFLSFATCFDFLLKLYHYFRDASFLYIHTEFLKNAPAAISCYLQFLRLLLLTPHRYDNPLDSGYRHMRTCMYVYSKYCCLYCQPLLSAALAITLQGTLQLTCLKNIHIFRLGNHRFLSVPSEFLGLWRITFHITWFLQPSDRVASRTLQCCTSGTWKSALLADARLSPNICVTV
jgi:hypothetical protein